MKTRVAVITARVLLAGVFIAAGWPKAVDPGAFIRDIWNFQLLPETWAYWIAAFVPYLEIAAGLAVVTGRQRRGAHVIIGALLPVFLFFHASAWARGLDISCGCFGSAAALSTAWHPAWWIALIAAMGGALILSVRADAETHPGASRHPSPEGI
jgi:putative oxidoreductase